MEFRCPACDTSYRVPVRIDQQVRCARCNHVWRVAETDFVFAEEERDDSGVPEAFGDASGYDESDDQDRGDAHSFSPAGFGRDQMGEEPAEQTESEPGVDADDQAIWGWPDAEAEAFSRQAADQPVGDAPPHDELEPHVEPDSANSSDDDTDVSSGARFWNGEPEGNAAKQSRAETEIAEQWFSTLVGDGVESREPAHDEAPAAGFERIMEGIEDVIAETGNAAPDDGPRENPLVSGSGTTDPLSHLVSRDKAQARDEAADRPLDAGGNDARREDNVVHFTASRAEHRLGRADEPLDPGGSVGLDTSDDDPSPAPASSPQTEHAQEWRSVADESAGRHDAAGENRADQGHDDGDDAGVRYGDTVGRFDYFAALRPGDHDKPERGETLADPFERKAGEPDEPDARELAAQAAAADDAHEAALRDSLTFDTARHDFADDGTDGEKWSASFQRDENDRDDDLYVMGGDDRVRDGAPQERGDDRTTMLNDRVEDDVLLAEYEFGDDDDDDAEQPPGVVAAQRAGRGAGRWMAAAAWSLFVVIFAGVAVATISFRAQITEVLPAAAPVYGAVGFPVETPPLVFDDVSYAVNGTPPDSLTLKGSLTSTADGIIEVPRLKVTVRDEAGNTVLEESRFVGQASIVPGQKVSFSLDLDVPPEELKTVELRF